MDDRRAFNADQTKPRLVVIDTATLKVERFVDLPGAAYGTAPTPDGRFLVMALPTVNKVGVLDLKTMQVTHTFDVPKAPQEVLVRPDGLDGLRVLRREPPGGRDRPQGMEGGAAHRGRTGRRRARLGLREALASLAFALNPGPRAEEPPAPNVTS